MASAAGSSVDGWTKIVGTFLAGVTAESDFLNQAAIGDPKTVRGHECQAYYYSGMAHLVTNELQKARGLFQKCIGTGVANFDEFTLAKAELARMH